MNVAAGIYARMNYPTAIFAERAARSSYKIALRLEIIFMINGRNDIGTLTKLFTAVTAYIYSIALAVASRSLGSLNSLVACRDKLEPSFAAIVAYLDVVTIGNSRSAIVLFELIDILNILMSAIVSNACRDPCFGAVSIGNNDLVGCFVKNNAYNHAVKIVGRDLNGFGTTVAIGNNDNAVNDFDIGNGNIGVNDGILLSSSVAIGNSEGIADNRDIFNYCTYIGCFAGLAVFALN